MMAVALSVLGGATPAVAVCNQTAASQADRNLWDTHACWQDFFLWQYRAYDMRSGDWSGRGWNDACNNLLEYPKHWNAAYLVTYGLLDNNDQSFHGTQDYRATGEAASTVFHDDLYHLPSDRTDVFGAYQPQSGPDQLVTACLRRQFEPSAQAIRNWVKQAGLDAGERTDGLTTEERDELERAKVARSSSRIVERDATRYYR